VEQGHARLAVEARSKLMSSAVTPRSRERRNSFRQAVDQFGRPYEQIWFKVTHNHLSVSYLFPDPIRIRNSFSGTLLCRSSLLILFSSLRYQ
jgi:hypothetical protein